MENKLKSGVLGQAVRTARLEKHMSQEELAEKIGITPVHIKHIESEHRSPSVDVLFRISHILNLSLDNLIFPEPDNATKEYQSAVRLLRQCNENHLKIVATTMNAMLKQQE